MLTRIVFAFLALLAGKVEAQVFVSSLDPIPAGWTGPVFQLSDAYPQSKQKDSEPWKNFDFRKSPKRYMLSVLSYFLEGNIEVDWVVQKNKKRNWYHAPSMSWQPSNRPYGREFVHGLTRERNSEPEELAATQIDKLQNWAVGFYNSVGAYTFGRVWSDTITPKAQFGQFEEGTVSAKLLFTAGTKDQVPYLEGAYEWEANIHKFIQPVGNPERVLSKVRLLQLDIAVKDSRSNPSCWVFGTFVYNNKAPGKTIWDKLVPAGLMWGNDPTKLNGGTLNETWINPEYVELFRFTDGRNMHLGYKGRLNGPVDNLVSSCMSCHSTAQYPGKSKLTPNINDPLSVAKYFRNISCGDLFDTIPRALSLDYSLQLSGGIAALVQARESPQKIQTLEKSEIDAIKNYIFTSMDDDIVPDERPPLKLSDDKEQDGGRNDDSSGVGRWLWWILIALVVLVIFSRSISKSKN